MFFLNFGYVSLSEYLRSFFHMFNTNTFGVPKVYEYIYFNSTFLNPFPFPETFGLGLRWLGCLRGRWRRCVFFFGEKGSEKFFSMDISH